MKSLNSAGNQCGGGALICRRFQDLVFQQHPIPLLGCHYIDVQWAGFKVVLDCEEKSLIIVWGEARVGKGGFSQNMVSVQLRGTSCV